MNKYTAFLSLLNFCFYTNAQVGINTNEPKSILDIKEVRENSINDISKADGLLIPTLTKSELALKIIWSIIITQ